MCFFCLDLQLGDRLTEPRSGVRACCTCYAKEVAILYGSPSLAIGAVAERNRPSMSQKVRNISFKSSDKSHSFKYVMTFAAFKENVQVTNKQKTFEAF